MRIEQLYQFIKVADLHSFSAASAETYLSQQAISTSVKNLEKEFKTELFTRTPKGVVLTDSGQYFYDIASQIIALQEQLYNHYLLASDESESIKVALNANLKNYYFPSVISYFLKNYPQCDIQYLTIDNAKILETILNQEATIGALPVLQIEKELLTTLPKTVTFTSFDATHYSLLTSKDSPLAHFNSISMSTIVKYPLIINTSADYSHDLFQTIIEHYCASPNTILVDSIKLQLQMVADNLGNMLYLQRTPPPSSKLVKIPITNDISLNIGFIHLANTALTPFQKFYLRKANTLIKTNFYQ